MLPRRAILLISLLLPLAALTGICVSKKKPLPQALAASESSVVTDEIMAYEKPLSAEMPVAVEIPAASKAPVVAETPAVSPENAVSFESVDSLEYAETVEPVAEFLAAIDNPVPAFLTATATTPEPTVVLQTAASSASTTTKKTKSTASAVSTKPVASSKSKLSKPAVEAIPSDTPAPSLYDRRTAQAPEKGILSWFGIKADGVRYDSRMIHAAEIAEERARHHSIRRCWQYVKEALLEAKVVDTYPQTYLAKQAGDELIRKHGFQRLSISDPYKAPVGSVLVYGGRGAGHVEIRTAGGFVSDFESPTPSKRPLLGIFVKPS